MVEVLSLSSWLIPTKCVCDLQDVLIFVTLLVCHWYCKCEFLNISDLYAGDLVIPAKDTEPVYEAEFVI